MEEKDSSYWEQKINFFLHNPINKALIKEIADRSNLKNDVKSNVDLFDIIASGLNRAQLPSYNSDSSKNGAIDFVKDPQITHPVSGKTPLKFTEKIDTVSDITKQIAKIIKEDTSDIDIDIDIDKTRDQQTYFNYLFFVLRKRLITRNCGNLGYLWDKLPSDSRIPDHCIWNHAGMVSALGSSSAQSDEQKISMVVFSISPIQPFIGKTRKLRDHWTASVILSWLAFEGIVSIMDNLGPDHIIYPSLHNQPLLEQHLSNKLGVFFTEYENDEKKKFQLVKDISVASFPNKFVFLAPSGKEQLFIAEIEKRIQSKWEEISNIVLEYIDNKKSDPQVKEIFKRQVNSWWQFSWSSSYLITLKNQKDIELLFGKDKFADLFTTIQKFSESSPKADVVYPVSHSLVQTALAASKSQPLTIRNPEPGEKCPVCGELEVLHKKLSTQNNIAKNYKEATDSFWQTLSKRYGTSTISEGEKLCAICSIKRFAPAAVKSWKNDHILKKLFLNDQFPSTTEMATVEFRTKLKDKNLLSDKKLERQLIEELHEKDEEYSPEIETLLSKAKKKNIKPSEEDNYYALLMMDGDKMGDLVNGITIAAKWEEVLHPKLVSRYKNGVLKTNKDLWDQYLDKQRILSPALHATISESLGTFSLYAVPSIIKKYKGKLIYAGGDDVAAVLPFSSSLDAAIEIKNAYNMRFASITSDGTIKEMADKTDGRSPIFLFPGIGEKISISAAILVCHHKQPLRGAIEETHYLLSNVAKEKKERDAVVVRLKKRSGHKRDFATKWNKINPFLDTQTTLLKSFQEIQDHYNEDFLSSSLIYRMPELNIMVKSILKESKKNETLSTDVIEKVILSIAYEINHSESFIKKNPGEQNTATRVELSRKLAAHIAGLIISWNKNVGKDGEWEYNGDVPIIASYFGKGGMR